MLNSQDMGFHQDQQAATLVTPPGISESRQQHQIMHTLPHAHLCASSSMCNDCR